MSTIAEKLTSLLSIKNEIKLALQEKGCVVTDEFATYPDLIRGLGSDTPVTPSDTVVGYTDASNNILVDDTKLNGGTYELKYEDASNTPLTGYDVIGTFSI